MTFGSAANLHQARESIPFAPPAFPLTSADLSVRPPEAAPLHERQRKIHRADAHVDAAAIAPAQLEKILTSPAAGLTSACRCARSRSQTPTGDTPNPPVMVYDCSGPYTDPAVKIDIRKGPAPCVPPGSPSAAVLEELPDLSSYGRQPSTRNSPACADLGRKPRRALDDHRPQLPHVKINANIGNSPSPRPSREEVEKMTWAIRWGRATR